MKTFTCNICNFISRKIQLYFSQYDFFFSYFKLYLFLFMFYFEVKTVFHKFVFHFWGKCPFRASVSWIPDINKIGNCYK